MLQARGALSAPLLRPVAWVVSAGAIPDEQRWLSIPELNIAEWATVCSIEACPAEAAGPLAGVVSGTFTTERARTIGVHLRGQEQPIGVTAKHPFYSTDRMAWVAAGHLRPGESIRTAEGEAVIDRVSLQPAIETVYNLEVAGTHTYFVAEARAWVHNGCVSSFAKESPRNFRRWAGRFKNPKGAHRVAREFVEEVMSEARNLGFKNIRHELGGARSGQWRDVWHINMDVPDGGRTLHLLSDPP